MGDPKSLPAGAETTIPGAGDPKQTVVGSTVEVSVVVSDADKLSDGQLFMLSTYSSMDDGATWQFVNGSTWQSYGPSGYVMTWFDGTKIVNPDPRLNTPTKQVGIVKVVIKPTKAVTATVKFVGK